MRKPKHDQTKWANADRINAKYQDAAMHYQVGNIDAGTSSNTNTVSSDRKG